jgi:hypothetical protein
MTKIFYGNQFVNSFWIKAKRYTRKAVIVLASFWALNYAVVIGGQLTTNTVYADREIIREIPIATKFEDIPMLVKICKAESGNRQFNKNGDVLRGTVNRSDIGYCQINEPIHNDVARKLGYDIYTEQGNKDYAIYLFMREGSTPWNSSKVLWNK